MKFLQSKINFNPTQSHITFCSNNNCVNDLLHYSNHMSECHNGEALSIGYIVNREKKNKEVRARVRARTHTHTHTHARVCVKHIGIIKMLFGFDIDLRTSLNKIFKVFQHRQNYMFMLLSLNVYMYVFTYICIYVYIFVHMCVYMYVYIYKRTHLSLSLYIYIYILLCWYRRFGEFVIQRFVVPLGNPTTHLVNRLIRQPLTGERSGLQRSG